MILPEQVIYSMLLPKQVFYLIILPEQVILFHETTHKSNWILQTSNLFHTLPAQVFYPWYYLKKYLL